METSLQGTLLENSDSEEGEQQSKESSNFTRTPLIKIEGTLNETATKLFNGG